MTVREKLFATYLNEVVEEKELVSVSDEELQVVFQCVVDDLHALIQMAYATPDEEEVAGGRGH